MYKTLYIHTQYKHTFYSMCRFSKWLYTAQAVCIQSFQLTWYYTGYHIGYYKPSQPDTTRQGVHKNSLYYKTSTKQ